jgi:hypothetical protein
MQNVNYNRTDAVPADYHCHACKATGVKLWRGYQDCSPRLLCRTCVQADQKREHSWAEGDQVGWYVPAVPDEEGVGYWGYTSVPAAGCRWWYRLAPMADVNRHPEYDLDDVAWVEHWRRQFENYRRPEGGYIARLFYQTYLGEAVRLGFTGRTRTGRYRLHGKTYPNKRAALQAMKARGLCDYPRAS